MYYVHIKQTKNTKTIDGGTQTMMMNEFVERTGFEPTMEEYREIEEAYYNFDGDKNAFCKH